MNHTTRTLVLKQLLNDQRRDARHYDIDLVPTQGHLQTVARIDDALAQLDAGKYGSCLECAREISERRLSVLPFAVRCQTCEDRREQMSSGTR